MPSDDQGRDEEIRASAGATSVAPTGAEQEQPGPLCGRVGTGTRRNDKETMR